MATYLTRNQTNGNQDKWTFASWVKRSNGGDNQCIFATSNGSTTSFDAKFNSDDKIEVYNYLGGGYGARLITNPRYTDVTSWYHIVIVYDSGNATEAQRLRIYVNGIEETSFSTTNYPSLNENSDLNVSGSTLDIGRQQNGSQFFQGYLAQTILADGQAYAPTVFGSTNANGVWVPITSPSVTYGTNGFKLEYKDSGAAAAASNFGADTSGNNNHFASNSLGTNPNTTDSPQNNFCILNIRDNQSVNLSKGGCDFDSSGGSDEGVRGSMGVIAGKWYYECKITGSAGLSAGNIGYAQSTFNLKNNPRGGQGMFVNGSSSLNLFNFSSSGTSLDAGAGVVQNDIIGFALNLTDNQLTVYKNGTQVGSTQTIASGLTSSGDFFIPVVTDDGGSNDVVGSFNFGNPTFTIASSNSDANGYGNFEYAVPSGFYALCTKNLAQYG